tara:strand:+ start:1294 stop:1581 length:288 start_codon:yes stop_codon:yes gene_type:complete
VEPVHSTFERVVRVRKKAEHPGESEVGAQQQEAFRARKMANDVSFKISVRQDFLYGSWAAVERVYVVVDDYDNLQHCHTKKPQTKADRAWVVKRL